MKFTRSIDQHAWIKFAAAALASYPPAHIDSEYVASVAANAADRLLQEFQKRDECSNT